MIFQQFEHADALIKLISVVEKRLEYVPTSPISKKKYATVLAPMVKVLQMLVKTYHKQQKRNSLRLIAFQLMREYRDSPFTSAEDVADVVGSAGIDNMIPTKCIVHRDGRSALEIEVKDVVVGDICILQNGTKIPADISRLIAVSSLRTCRHQHVDWRAGAT